MGPWWTEVGSMNRNSLPLIQFGYVRTCNVCARLKPTGPHVVQFSAPIKEIYCCYLLNKCAVAKIRTFKNYVLGYCVTYCVLGFVFHPVIAFWVLRCLFFRRNEPQFVAHYAFHWSAIGLHSYSCATCLWLRHATCELSFEWEGSASKTLWIFESSIFKQIKISPTLPLQQGPECFKRSEWASFKQAPERMTKIWPRVWMVEMLPPQRLLLCDIQTCPWKIKAVQIPQFCHWGGWNQWHLLGAEHANLMRVWCNLASLANLRGPQKMFPRWKRTRSAKGCSKHEWQRVPYQLVL